ncbi:MAG: hypothetical protein VX605_01655 [Pseudomonadota bacterium]|nr:hypothetical protein [Pseudomonadota bacterium]MED6332228.1 hypothetical protein [Pseudomonadota bacterium]MEE3143360.1 hypothetical protein [Pseudomonadota bacterium]|tara:strand:+ start:151 stop:741 length:591 start_codon:yes stop_codon:yes gene_type:complete
MQKLTWIAGLGFLLSSTALLAAEEKRVSRGGVDQLDINGDGVISFVEFQESDRNGLSRLDTDNNGVLTIDEFLNTRPNFRPRSRVRGDQQSGQQNDRPDPDELDARRAQMRERMTARAEERFHEMDVNGDEMITLAEFQEANFDAMDRDGDGVLTGRELRRQRRSNFGGPTGSRESGSRRGSDRRGRPRGNSGGQS